MSHNISALTKLRDNSHTLIITAKDKNVYGLAESKTSSHNHKKLTTKKKPKPSLPQVGEVSAKQCGFTKISAHCGSPSKDVNVEKEGEGVESEANSKPGKPNSGKRKILDVADQQEEEKVESVKKIKDVKNQKDKGKNILEGKNFKNEKKDDEQVDDEETSLKKGKRRRKQKGPSEAKIKELLDHEYPKMRSRVVPLSLFKAIHDAKVTPEKFHDMFGVPIGGRSLVSLDEKLGGHNDLVTQEWFKKFDLKMDKIRVTYC
ncbi:hypothetical protein Tco_0695279 [Tanacetum coccineum]